MQRARRANQTEPEQQTRREDVEPRRSSGGSIGFIFIAFALLFIVGPIVATSSGIELPAGSPLMLMGFGVVLLLIGFVVTVITRLYIRVPADLAFVRTGMGGAQVILDGGAIVVRVVHEVVWVSLRTMKFEIQRAHQDSLITKDFLRADVTCEFFVHVERKEETVKQAATSLGAAAINSSQVQAIVGTKLDSALRGVAAEMTLTELISNRAEFRKRVEEHVKADISLNGLTLETVTISRVDQTDTSALRDDNIFDAQGKRMIASITAEQGVQTNQIQMDAQRKIREAQVNKDQSIFAQDVLQAQAEADRERDIKVAQATATQEAATRAAEQDQLAKVAGVTRDQAIELAQVAQAQAVDVANQQREQAARTAEIIKEQTVEVASRQREVAVATAETERANAQAAQLTAEAERAQRAQAVTTVEVTAKAERDKKQTVIGAEADAEKRRVNEQISADISAYTTVTNATAEQDAATRRAAARISTAEADQKAKALEAAGTKAVELVPVEVDRERVTVENARVDVLTRELATKAEHESISRGLQVDLARIAAERDVNMEAARSFGVALSQAHMTIWGDPDTVARMSRAFLGGQQNGRYIDGLANTLPPGVRDSLGGLGQILASLMKDKLGVDLSPEVIEEEIAKAQGAAVAKN